MRDGRKEPYGKAERRAMEEHGMEERLHDERSTMERRNGAQRAMEERWAIDERSTMERAMEKPAPSAAEFIP